MKCRVLASSCVVLSAFVVCILDEAFMLASARVVK